MDPPQSSQASFPKWECILDPASLCKIILQNLSALPQQDSASQETTGDHEQWDDSPALITPRSWLVYAQQKLEESILQWDKRTVFYASYFTVMHCYPLCLLLLFSP
jgi:hypothetical protein